jgi:hypothetical protein
MKLRLVPILLAAFSSAIAFAGFKVKLVEPKQPEKFQVHATVAGVTYAADLLVDAKEQKKYFYRELSPSHIIALRLAIFNNGKGEVVLPLQTLRLIGPDGKEITPVDPAIVAEAVLRGRTVVAGESKNPAAVVSPGMRTGDPRLERNDPRYDPRLDPNDPRYDPTLDPNRPTYDPNDPRSRYPNDPRYGGAWGRPGVDVVLSPGGGSNVDLTEHEQALVRKDFDDKAHSTDPIGASEKRDRFLYFSIASPPSGRKGFKLQIAPSKGIPQEVVLEF